MISSKLRPSILKILGICSKGKKLSSTPTLNHVPDPSTNVVDQTLDSSASTTLTPEVNIDTATTEAAASTALDVPSSVPEPGNTATGILPQHKIQFLQQKQQPLQLWIRLPLLLGRESRPLIIQKLILLAKFFSLLIRNMISSCNHLATERSKSGSIVIGLKTKIGNACYTTMHKKMRLFVLLA